MLTPVLRLSSRGTLVAPAVTLALLGRLAVLHADLDALTEYPRLLGWQLQELRRGRETEPLVDGHSPTAGVNRHPTRSKAQGVLHGGLHER